MSKYISIEEAKSVIRRLCRDLQDRTDINTELNLLPSIEIIRCKECKYRGERCENWHIEEYVDGLGLDGAMFVPDSDFSCIYAEC